MSMREFWFYGDGVMGYDLEEFCTEERYEALQEALRCNELSLQNPLGTFYDDDDNGAIIISPYQIDPLCSPEQLLQKYRFLTKEQVAQEIYDALAADYFDLTGYQAYLTEEAGKPVTLDEVKATMIQSIMNSISYLELCFCG